MSGFSERTDPCQVTLLGGHSTLQFYVIPRPYPDEFDGVAGWPRLSSNIWEFQLSRRGFGAKGKLPDDINTWKNATILTGTTVLTFQFDSPQSRVELDTGQTAGIILPAGQWNEWRKQNPLLPNTIEGSYMPGAGVTIDEQVLAPVFRCGPLTLHNIMVVRANSEETRIATPGTSAIMGIACLNQMDVVLDGKSQVAYFKMIEHVVGKPDYNRLGAVFIPRDPTASDLTAYVGSSSPAAKAGLMNGDILIKVGTLDVTKWRTEKGILPLLRFWTMPAGTQHTLTVIRDGKELKIKVRLADFL